MKESNFSRNVANLSKAGAYYTDLGQCERMSHMFSWPDEEVCILEPSAGDGSAVKMVTKNAKNRKIFAVELDKDAANALHADKEIMATINADFFDCKISNKAFSFVFSNPPYIEGLEIGRMEVAFLKKMTKYIKFGGILVYVIPFNVVQSDEFKKYFNDNYERLEAFRFSDEEYNKFHQIVIVGRRVERQEREEQFTEIFKEDFEVLPDIWEKEKIIVNKSKENAIKFFTTSYFDDEYAYSNLLKSNPQKENLKNVSMLPFVEDNIPNPPILPNANIMYLLSTLGCGSGMTGSAENMDEHLQRGKAKVQIYKTEEEDDNGNTVVVTKKTTKITVTILEQSGKFTVLE